MHPRLALHNAQSDHVLLHLAGDGYLTTCPSDGSFPFQEIVILIHICDKKMLPGHFKSLQSLQQLLDRLERSSMEEVVGPHPMADTLNDTSFTQQAQMV